MSLEDGEPGQPCQPGQPGQQPAESQQPEPQQPELPELRKITDAQTMRALAHPVRIALIEELSVAGPMTATEVGERIGESPTTCSFHLRQLAKYGFVEEAGGGKGRARPWRMTSIGMSFSDTHEDPEAEIAANALSRVIRERQLGRYQTWLQTKAAYPRRWREAADESEWGAYLTAEELDQVNAEIVTLLRSRFRERLTDPSKRPPGAALVEMLVLSYPISPPSAIGDEPADQGTE
jgi:DNA-binding transcriptional ArsR family regulator